MITRSLNQMSLLKKMRIIVFFILFFPLIAWGQGTTVSGKVVSSDKQALPGVTIMLKGTSTGTTSDIDGNFVLSGIPNDAILIFSFVGMHTQEIAVGNRKIIDVVMEEEAIGLGEVVAIGYGTTKKSNLTGSVSSISGKHFKDQPVKRIEDILQGRSPRVEVTNLSGMPGASVKVRVRGTTSINKGSEPLYISG